ncbi:MULTISPECIES: MFS transporter [Bacillus]|uniref:MFS transporter n=1 Tax=Bacillus TaxID=1386 RepID=UPI0009DAA604|nr:MULTISPECIES: MFS transporter [Bacillus]
MSPSTSSFTISLPTITMAFTMLIVSVFSNAWGRKQIMMVSLLATSLLSIASAFSPSFHILLLFRFAEGVALAGFPAIAMTYLSEEISPRSIGSVMGVYIAGSAIGGFAGRMITSVFTDFFYWHTAILVLGLFSLICAILFILLLPKSKNFAKSTVSFTNWIVGNRNALKNPGLLFLFGMGFLFLGSYASLFNYIGFPLSEEPFSLSQTVIGALFILQLIGTWSSIFFGKLTASHSRAKLMSYAIILLIIGVILTLSQNLFIVLIGVVLFVCGFFAGHSLASGWVSSISSVKSKAYASSLYLFFYYLGSSIVGWSGGLFLASFDWTGVVCMILGISLLLIFLLIQITRSLKKVTAKAETFYKHVYK